MEIQKYYNNKSVVWSIFYICAEQYSIIEYTSNIQRKINQHVRVLRWIRETHCYCLVNMLTGKV